MKKILILILILILPIVTLAAALFSDGFKSGDLSAWSSNENDGGDLSATNVAKLHGNYGLNVFIDDQNEIYVRDDTPNAETRYRCRFYLDPNTLTIPEGDRFIFLLADDGASWSFWGTLRIDGGSYKINIADRADDAYNKSTALIAITDAPHCIEFDWTASSGVGQNDGEFTLWIDGVLKETVTAVDSDTETISRVYLGAMTFTGTDVAGTFYLDDFDSNDNGTLIGQIGDNAIMFGCNF